VSFSSIAITLKPFFHDKDKVDPVDIARRDHLEYFIERIFEFDGDIKRVSTLRYHVKWLGYDDSHNSWERWKNLMNTEQLHTYLISVNRHLIPRKFLNLVAVSMMDFFLIFCLFLYVFQEVLVSKSLT
jgi:Chromo (CHRromatin Organisation MOdifier) domain